MHKEPSRSWPILKGLLVIALLALVALVYYPGLSGSFIFDDTSNIVENPSIQMASPDWASVKGAATAYGSRFPHRPVSTISLAFDHWLWDGEAYGFKLTNLALHLVTTLLILLLARQLFRLASPAAPGADSFWPAAAIAAIWAIHPLQVSTVLYVVQRMEMLAALFIVLSLLAYIAARVRLQSAQAGGWGFMAVAGLFTLLGVFSKETGALAPFLMLALEVLVFRFAMALPRSAGMLKVGFSVIVLAAIVVYMFWLVPESVSGEGFVKREFTWDERLLTQLRVLPMYIGWILFPATDHYLFYYDHFTHSQDLLTPITTLLGAILLVAMLVVAWLVRRRSPLVALGIVWFFIAHALTSNLFSLELVFEHRNYFAIFAILLAVIAAVKAVPRFAESWKSSAAAVTVVLVLGLGILTAIRSATWGDAMHLALHHVAINPESERAGLDLAELYLGNDGWDPSGSPFVSSAISQLKRVARLPTSHTTADQALIVLAAQSDELPSREAWERLIRKVRTQALNAADYDALYNLVQQRYRGMALDDDRLWQLHNVLCERSDIPPEIHVRFGWYAALRLQDRLSATAAFKRALELLDGSQRNLDALTDALREAGIELRDDVASCAGEKNQSR